MPQAQWPVLASYVAFGFSATSFLHRRRNRDREQAEILSIFAGAFMVVGLFSGADVPEIMAVHMPWAVCATMVASVVNFHFGTTAMSVKGKAFG